MRIAKTITVVVLSLFAILYAGLAITLALSNEEIATYAGPGVSHRSIAIFGASGTAGDGILKAALADPVIDTIHVLTRRATPRIDEGIATGKVQMTLHTDYLDYTGIEPLISDIDAVYWAIGTSSLGVDEETYGMIHVDFPARFLEAWMAVTLKAQTSFHYISSSDISEDSGAMWAREKFRAELTLFALAENTQTKVIAYRPDYIGPTEEEANFGQMLAYGFFAPVGAAVKALQIGESMIEVTARLEEFDNGHKIGTRSIIRYSDAYRRHK